MRLCRGGWLAIGLFLVPLCAIAEEEGSGFSLSDISLPLPPIATGGNVGYTFQTLKHADSDRTFRHLTNATVIAQSYIWQPWFSTVDGYLTLTQSKVSTGSEVSDSGNATGKVNLSFLPRSNYPTTLTYSRTDSSQSTDQTNQWAQSDSISLGSRIRWDKTLNFTTNMAYALDTQSKGADVTNSSIALAGSKIFDNNDVGMRLRYSARDQGDNFVADSAGTMTSGAQAQDTISLSLRHQYTPWENVSYDSTSSLLMDARGSPTEQREATVMQATSTLRWAPDEYPFTASAVWTALTDSSETNYTNASTISGDTSSSKASYDGRVGLIYNFTEQLSGDVSLDGALRNVEVQSTVVTDGDDKGEDDTVSQGMTIGGAANLNYTALPSLIFGFNWYWNAGGSLDARGGNEGVFTNSQKIRGGQSISRGVNVPLIGNVQWSANQNASISHATTSSLVPTLSHSTMAAFQEMEGERWTVISLSAADNRTLARKDPTSGQLFNMQITKGLEPDINSSWTANITVQFSRQSQNGEEGLWNSSSQGGIGYQRRNVFSIRALDFNADLSLTSSTYAPVSFKTANEVDRNSATWNRELTTTLKYNFGRIALQGRLRLTQNEQNDISDMFVFSVLRGF
ncbi:MAG: hypothetical protein JKY27_03915 [Magnetovibrio sp.]|nr:hypothetical protein [Magnetovibrio sp.]